GDLMRDARLRDGERQAQRGAVVAMEDEPGWNRRPRPVDEPYCGVPSPACRYLREASVPTQGTRSADDRQGERLSRRFRVYVANLNPNIKAPGSGGGPGNRAGTV